MIGKNFNYRVFSEKMQEWLAAVMRPSIDLGPSFRQSKRAESEQKLHTFIDTLPETHRERARFFITATAKEPPETRHIAMLQLGLHSTSQRTAEILGFLQQLEKENAIPPEQMGYKQEDIQAATLETLALIKTLKANAHRPKRREWIPRPAMVWVVWLAVSVLGVFGCLALENQGYHDAMRAKDCKAMAWYLHELRADAKTKHLKDASEFLARNWVFDRCK